MCVCVCVYMCVCMCMHVCVCVNVCECVCVRYDIMKRMINITSSGTRREIDRNH